MIDSKYASDCSAPQCECQRVLVRIYRQATQLVGLLGLQVQRYRTVGIAAKLDGTAKTLDG